MAHSSAAFATRPYGTFPYASDTVHDKPTVTIDAPTAAQVITTGGPSIIVSWTYSQAQSDPQTKYRVRIENDAGTTTHYDSGWLSGANASHVVDLVDKGVPTDSTDLSCLVEAESDLGSAYRGISARRFFDVLWGVVTTTITSPVANATVTSSDLTAQWTFSSTRSKTQQAYRARLIAPTSGFVYEDSGWVTSAVAVSYAFSFKLTDGSQYKVGLTLRNSEGVPSTSESTVSISTALADPADVADVDEVGRTYEVSINGKGYMLRHIPERDVFRRRFAVPLEAERVVEVGASFNEKVDRYDFTAWAEFSAGAGQRFYEREKASPLRFWDSEGINPFEEQGFTLLNTVVQEEAQATTPLFGEVVGDDLYWHAGTNQIKRLTAVGGAPATVTTVAAGTFEDITSDGTQWYACDGNAVWRGTSADPGAAWSTEDVKVVSWAANRLCVGIKTGASATPNKFGVLNSSGVLEANGTITLDEGWTVTKATFDQGYIYFGAHKGERGLVYRWKVGTTDTPSVALPLPHGQRPVSVFGYQGAVNVRADHVHTAGSSVHGIVYRCPIEKSTGELTPFLALEQGGSNPTADHGPGTFHADERYLYFSWPQMTAAGKSGVGVIDLATGGYAKWYDSGVTGHVRRILSWQGHLIFMVDGQGVYRRTNVFVADGWVRTSISDKSSTLDKVYDTTTLTCVPLRVNESIELKYSLDFGDSYSSLTAATMSAAGDKRKTTTLDKVGTNIGLEIHLKTSTGTTTPQLAAAQVRQHVLGLADIVLVLPIDCSDNVRGLNGKPLKENGPGVGIRRAKALEELLQSRVKVQDSDWAFTQTTETFEVKDVRVETLTVGDRSRGQATTEGLAVVTLQKRGR